MDTSKPANPSTYQGKPVATIRSARADDPGYDVNQDRVVVTLGDGSTHTVPRVEVTSP